MNILFVYSSPIVPESGGVQRVTKVLSSFLEQQGCKTYYLSLNREDNMDDKQYVLPVNKCCNNIENQGYLCELLDKLKINIIVNQDVLNKDTSTLILSCKPDNIKLISVAHNSIIGAVRHFRYSRLDLFRRIHLTWLLPFFDARFVNDFMVWMFKQTHKAFFRKIVSESDNYVLLSSRYIEELEYVLGEKCGDKVVAISNPCTIINSDNGVPEKEKVVLYVGRIDFAQKRNDLLLSVWSKVHGQVQGWKLVFVGNGPDLDKLKAMGDELGLHDVEYVGQTSPIEYYKRASVFCLTSAFEGLPLTIIEAMSYGVVPMAFDSFASLKSLIEDNENGLIIKPFDIDNYAKGLLLLLCDNSKLCSFSKKAYLKSKVFSLDAIGRSWLNIFE